jgi:endonuclease YncB( thermonuclease family)
MQFRLLLCLALLVPAVHAGNARTFRATVTHVTDGDTVWVRPSWGGAAVQVRLQGLDAPEICQRWGQQAKAALQSRVLHQPVVVQASGHDDYGRTVARLLSTGEDVGRSLVASGLAWSYRSSRSAGPYADIQAQARAGRRGLWSDPRPQEPRAFRRQHGSCVQPNAS